MSQHYINQWTAAEFEKHLKEFADADQAITKIEIAGDGNMNFTLRLKFADGSSIIAKQSPPFCARFPDIPAPEDRIFSEIRYYQLLEKDAFLTEHSPALLGMDHENNIAYISDLGQATDFEYLYAQDKKLDQVTCEKLLGYLVKLHSLEIPPSLEFKNLEMRNLNHEYIFDLPFREGERAIDLDKITDGLAEVADNILSDQSLRKAAKELGQLYYENASTLIHGDYYPMSWIKTEKGLFIIDPEFGFLGLPEIDIGFFLAHMLLSDNFKIAYNTVLKQYDSFDEMLVTKFCAVEVIRRITYVSQLPIINNLSFKSQLLAASAEALKTGKMEVYEIFNHNNN